MSMIVLLSLSDRHLRHQGVFAAALETPVVRLLTPPFPINSAGSSRCELLLLASSVTVFLKRKWLRPDTGIDLPAGSGARRVLAPMNSPDHMEVPSRERDDKRAIGAGRFECLII
jgi:hypothetical protein